MSRRRPRTPFGVMAGLIIASAGALSTAPPAAASWEVDLVVSFYKEGGFGDGRGTVKSDDGSIDCAYDTGSQSGDCSAQYIVPDFVEEIYVDLTVTPAPGSYVCTTRDTNCVESGDPRGYFITFTRSSEDDDQQVFPSLNLREFPLGIDLVGPGTVEVAGGRACNWASYEICRLFKYGTLVELTAVPDAGYPFNYWFTNCENESQPTCAFHLYGAAAIGAVFGRAYFYVDHVGEGKVCATGAIEACETADEPYISEFTQIGGSVTLEAKPAAGWTFDRWNAAPCLGKPATCTLDFDGGVDLRATFKRLATPAPTPRPTSNPAPAPSPSPGTTLAPAPSSISAATPAASPAAGAPTPVGPALPTASMPGAAESSSADASPSPSGATVPGGSAATAGWDGALLLLIGLIVLFAVFVVALLAGRRRRTSGDAPPIA